MANDGSVPMPVKPPSSRIQLPWLSRSAARLVHCWPPAGTYCRSSSQIGQRDGDGSPNCVPQVRQIGRSALG